ncbi:pseudaminic acid synthase [Helicobacter didelphidarum]|uniref:Pseudaminic acid synthase n=1 Tax=Helicobacter didelphidarum TaxID=2040648 RepID=A0A3D8IJN1_9HELI|nr:pseudaminic acid synthase [Helicobacter didelphidarum]RDU65368.1 pseudaminic acid synthase [Helicobacter didelphidarum]
MQSQSLTPPFIIAELSANHNQSLDIALKSIEAIATTGANAIKVQTYKPSCLTLPYRNEYFRIQDGLWKDSYLWNLYENAQMPWEWHKEIFTLAKSLGLIAFSSPFSTQGVELLESLNCPIYKIASFEVMHPILLRAIAQTKKPVIMSLGVANEHEIEYALEILRDNSQITLLYCISEYPANISEAKLTNIRKMKQKWQQYNVSIGLSDHTLGISVPIMATLCGASMIEKHFILDKKLGGVDSAFSLDISEFREMVKGVQEICTLAQDFIDEKLDILDMRHAKSAKQQPLSFNTLMNPPKENSSDSINLDKPTIQQNIMQDSQMKENRARKGRQFARSLFIAKNVKKGEVLSLENIACVRPSSGLSPLQLDSILGKTFRSDYQGGIPLLEEYIT